MIRLPTPRRSRHCLVLFTALSVCMSSLPLAAEEPAAPAGARATLEAFSRGLEGLAADFEQVVISQDGAIMEEGAGDVWLARPDRFRWSYHGDFPELIVADGAHVWLYDEGLEQVTVHRQSSRAGDSPLLMITDLDGMDEAFQVTELGTVSGLQLLELASLEPEAQFERMVLGFQDGELNRLVLEDAFGLRTELSFSNVRRNPPVPEGHFRFTPPEGVDLVGEVPDFIAGQEADG